MGWVDLQSRMMDPGRWDRPRWRPLAARSQAEFRELFDARRAAERQLFNPPGQSDHARENFWPVPIGQFSDGTTIYASEADRLLRERLESLAGWYAHGPRALRRPWWARVLAWGVAAYCWVKR